MKGKSIRFTDEQWAILQEIAQERSVTISDLVRDAAGLMVSKAIGREWPGVDSVGGARRVEYRRMRGDIMPYAWEYAIADGKEIVASGVAGHGLVWQGDDPHANNWVGTNVKDLLAAGFERPGKWRVWARRWYKEFGYAS